MRSVQGAAHAGDRREAPLSASSVRSRFREGDVGPALGALEELGISRGWAPHADGQFWEWLSYWYPGVRPAGAPRERRTDFPASSGSGRDPPRRSLPECAIRSIRKIDGFA